MRTTDQNANSESAPKTGYFYRPGVLEALEQAAARLAVDPDDLRARCERALERCGDVAIAHLPDGVVGFETDGQWRFRFPIGHTTDNRESRASGETP